MPKLALLDGHSLAYRAFYALPSDLATSSGQVTNAVFGFTSMLIKLIGDEVPDGIGVAWDLRGPTFRSGLYPEYKAQRQSAPDLFTSQLPLIREVLEVLHVPQVSVPGFEADDVIATLATQAVAADWECLIVTGDRDAFQLAADDITILYTRRGVSDTIRATPAWIEERYGVAPHRYVEYAALRGDPSDNLPGVAGVGEKTAARLLATYGSLEGVYGHLDEQTPNLRRNLATAQEQVFLNRRLMKLAHDVVFPETESGRVELEAFNRQAWDHEAVREVFDGLAFRVLWERLADLELGDAVATGCLEVEVVRGEVESLLVIAAQEPLVTAPVWKGNELIGAAVALDDSSAQRLMFSDLNSLATTKSGIAGHDVKSMLRHMALAEMDLPAVAYDTALAAYVINHAQRVPTLDELARQALGVALDPEDDDSPTPRPQGVFDFASNTTCSDWEAAARRAVAIRQLIPELRAQVEARGGEELLTQIELPLIPLLARMEATGIAVDRAFLSEFGDQLRSRLALLEAEIHEAAGGGFNVNSTIQLREVLFERLGLPVVKKTPKGAPSTDASVLQKLRQDHPIVDRLLEYRELEKLRSTYVDGLLPLVDPDGRVRGRFNQMAAATGRLSQENPNLQNIPIRSEEGRAIRMAFTAEPGKVLVVADYNQIELRVLAHLSQDPGLIDAFEAGDDIHKATAARINAVDMSEVSVEQRRRAKMVNFGLLYGMEAYGLAQRLGISRQEAAEQIDAYFSQFPQVRNFMKSIVTDAREVGYTTTLLGRRRYLPELASSNFRDRQAGERMALNAPIQGEASDIIKKAMVELDHELRRQNSGAELLLQVHDELVLEVPVGELDDVAELTRQTMEGVVNLDVPVLVDVASGQTLADAKS